MPFPFIQLQLLVDVRAYDLGRRPKGENDQIRPAPRQEWSTALRGMTASY
jgi:hypothetical protein